MVLGGNFWFSVGGGRGMKNGLRGGVLTQSATTITAKVRRRTGQREVGKQETGKERKEE